MVFFDGVTDSSGVIERITLPAPRLDLSNLDEPNKTVYTINTINETGNINKTYLVNMYENVSVIQNINVVPDMNMGGL